MAKRFDSEPYGDYPDEYGNVTCQVCGRVNDLPDGRRTTICANCGSEIDSRTGERVMTDIEQAWLNFRRQFDYQLHDID